MPRTLYFYILKETLKLLLIAATVLVVLISTAAAIKPLTDGLLAPASMMKFVLYTAPTMLQFALPFAAAFATTLFFSRMVSDNEVTACSASGMSYFTILFPILALGVALLFGLYGFSNHVVPRFNQAAASMVERDLIRMLVTEIQRGQSKKIGKLLVYADDAEERDPTEAEKAALRQQGSTLEPYRVIMLNKVAVSALGDAGQTRKEATSQRANIFLYQDGSSKLASFYLEQPVIYDPVSNDLFQSRDLTFVQRIESPLSDKPQFLSSTALAELRGNMERSDAVRREKDELVRLLARENLLRHIEAQLGAGKAVVLLDPTDDRYLIAPAVVKRTGRGLELTGIDGGLVQIEARHGREVYRKITSPQVVITSRQDEFALEPRAVIELHQAQVRDPRVERRGEARPAEHVKLDLPPMHWPNTIVGGLAAMPGGALLALARSEYAQDRGVQQGAARFSGVLDHLRRDILAQVHQRASSAFTCMFVLLLGALLPMVLRHKPALVVYFWSFLLTLGVVIINQSGQTMCNNLDYNQYWGVTIIWAGNLLLIAAIVMGYMKVVRN
ncbi:MAG: LptF/LptG family permease [Phycisphaeraceae bacterium]